MEEILDWEAVIHTGSDMHLYRKRPSLTGHDLAEHDVDQIISPLPPY